MSRLTIAVIFGGRSVEHQVSLVSARTVVRALSQAGYDVVPLGIAQDGCWLEPDASDAALSGDVRTLSSPGKSSAETLSTLLLSGAHVVFPLIHGTWGEDGSLQGLCEMLGLPYVGAGVAASAVCMDKLLCKRQLQAMGLPVVEYAAVSRRRFESDPEAFVRGVSAQWVPLFVKPAVGGSSVGIQKVEALDELEEAIRLALRFDHQVVVERGIEGRELECSVLGYEELEASSVGEIIPGNPFYDYADKYLEDGAQLLAPAELPDEITERVRQLARDAFAAAGGWGMARVDFLMESESVIYVNEINTLPGFTDISMYPRLWEISGLPLPRLVDRLVQIALRRDEDQRRLDAGIREWLSTLEARHAGSPV